MVSTGVGSGVRTTEPARAGASAHGERGARSTRRRLAALWARREVRVLVWITLGAFVLRMAWLLAAQPAAVSDALGYKSLAERVLEEGRYERFGEPTAWRTPGYIFVLVAGLVVSDSDVWLGAINVVIATAIVPLVALLARRLGLSWRVSLLAAALTAVMSPLVLWAPVQGPENVQVPLLLAALALAADRRTGARAPLVWAGVLFGVAILVRPESLVYLPVVALVMVPGRWRSIALRSATVAVVAIAVCVPWLVRNQLQVGPVGFSSTGGVNFYFAHGADDYGFEHYEQTPLGGLDEVEMSRRGYELGRERLSEDPAALIDTVRTGTEHLYDSPRYAPFFSSRAFATEAPYPRGTSAELLAAVRGYNLAVWYGVAVLSVLGWLLLVRRRHRAALVLTGFAAANWFCFAVVFWALPRYRFPVEPMLCLAAAVAVDAALRWRRARRPGESGGGQDVVPEAVP